MRHGRWLAALFALAVLATGCNSDDPKDAPRAKAGDGAAEGNDEHGDGGDHEHTEPTLVDPATGKQGRIRESDKYTAGSPPPPSFRPPDQPGEQGQVSLAASVSPPCVEHGQKLTVTLKTDPFATVAAQIKWPNEQFSGLDNTRATTGADGIHTWVVDVKPTALVGIADLMAAAIDERRGHQHRTGSHAGWQFVVAPPGRC